MMREIGRWLAWPFIATLGFGLTQIGIAHDWGMGLVLTVVYLTLAVAIGVLERVLPHQASWNLDDGEVAHDVVFTLAGSGLAAVVVQAALLVLLGHAAARLAQIAGAPLWPSRWPVLAQVVFTVVLADLGAYWAHRLCHERAWLWPFHAIHHSVRRLWWLNSGRIHAVDVGLTFVLSTPPLILLGAPESMMIWLASATSVIGMLSHCNIAMHCGWLDRVFNTPSVHRWHHSLDRAESDANYGENTMIWDLLLGTYFLPDREPPAEIGTRTWVPPNIVGQMLAPLVGLERYAASSWGRRSLRSR